MNEIFIALCIGIIAGLIDIIPMIMQKLDKYAIASAFTHWVALGVIIPFVNWNITPWLKGSVIAIITTIPIILIIKDKKAIIPITILSIILGGAIGFVGSIFI